MARPLLSARAAAVVAACLTLTVSARAQDAASAAASAAASEATYKEIARCLAGGEEIVMNPGPKCVPRQQGEGIADKEGMPLKESDWTKVCQNEQDARQLPPSIVKRLVKEAQIAPSGIRIIGAVFCKGLDLAGADLPYSLVLDRAAVLGIIDARNMRLRGDFSFEYALILGPLRLNRSRVEGSIYGTGSFLQRLRAYDSQVSGSWQQTKSIIFYDAHFVRLTISGDLNVNSSAFGRLWVQSSRVNGTLELDKSEARCAYHINASTLGYLTVNQAGFGVVEEPGKFPWWRRTGAGAPAAYTQMMFQGPAIKKLADDLRERLARPKQAAAKGPRPVPGCSHDDRIEGMPASDYLEFYVFDTNVQSVLCLTSFAWLAPKGKDELPDAAHWVSILALNGTKIGGNLIVDLWNDGHSKVDKLRSGQPDYDRVRHKHKIEAVGLSTTALIFDFSDNAKPYFTYIDGLKFDRIHKAEPACSNDFGAKLGSQPELPSVDDAMAWLDKNDSTSSQPFLTFVQAFERAGADASELKIKWKTTDLCTKSPRWMGAFQFLPCWRVGGDDAAFGNQDRTGIGSALTALFRAVSSPSTWPSPSAIGAATWHALTSWGLIAAIVAAFVKLFLLVAEHVALSFQWTLWAVADHGIRPGKVVWWVGGVLLVFWELIWRHLGIVAYQPKTKDDAKPAGQAPLFWPITMLFLFDRLIPLYKIRDEHYSIAKVYRQATPEEVRPGPPTPDAPPYEMYYLRKKYFICPAGEGELRRLEKWLVVLRIIGAGLTIFLLAAIAALTR